MSGIVVFGSGVAVGLLLAWAYSCLMDFLVGTGNVS